MMIKIIVPSSLKIPASIATTFLAGAFLIAALTTTNAAVIFNQEFQFFDVSGKDTLELFKDIKKKSPLKDKKRNEGKAAAAAIKIIPNADYTIIDSRCHIKTITITVDVVIHQPRWLNYSEANSKSKVWWDNFIHDTKVHELKHAAIAKKHATLMQKKMMKHRSRSSCDKLEASLTGLVIKLLKNHDKAQLKFDKKEAGRIFRTR